MSDSDIFTNVNKLSLYNTSLNEETLNIIKEDILYFKNALVTFWSEFFDYHICNNYKN